MPHQKFSLLLPMMKAREAQFHRAFAVGIELKDCSTFNSFRWAAVSLTDVFVAERIRSGSCRTRAGDLLIVLSS